MHRSALISSTSILALACLAGCGNKLETGYQPRALGASAVERRAYFAGPFTPAAREAQLNEARETQFQRRRPGDRF